MCSAISTIRSPIDSPQAEKIRRAVKRAKLTAVLGLSERDGGSLYIAQWLIGPDGETIARRRKLRPTHAERTVFGEGDGSDLAVHDRADVGRLGALCCWEHLQPLSKYAMYAQNEQVHVGAWPSFSLYDPFAHALGHEVNNAASKVYAVEGSCFLLGPCAVGLAGDDRRALRLSRKARFPACRRRPRRDLRAGRQFTGRETRRPTRKAFCMPMSTSA